MQGITQTVQTEGLSAKFHVRASAIAVVANGVVCVAHKRWMTQQEAHDVVIALQAILDQ